MNVRSILSAMLLSVFLFPASGCNYLMTQLEQPDPEREPGRQKRVTKAEIDRAVEECQNELPHRIDDDLMLTKITFDYTGTINGWYQVSDDLTSKLRRVGNVKIEERMEECVKKLDLEKADVPEQLRQILSQNEFAIQYIFEDRYGLAIASVVVSKETMDGEERIGRTHENPFAVKNVSLTGGESGGDQPEADASESVAD